MLSDETAPPLSDAIIATMREHLACCWVNPEQERRVLRLDIRMLLWEVERLRGEVKLCVELLNLE